MIVENMGLKYHVEWSYGAKNSERGDYRPLSIIVCRVYLRDKDRTKITLTTGQALQNYKDPYNPFIGQREALSNALKAHPFSKNERKRFWDVFFAEWEKVKKDNLPE